MASNKLKQKMTLWKLSLRAKITLGLSAIAAVLLVSSIISWMEYSRMSTYVSELMARNIHSINMAQSLAEVTNAYNLEILTVVGDERVSALPDFDQKAFVAHCDSLKKTLTSVNILPLADSVLYSYSAYMLTTLELNDVILSDFIDSRTWYFDTLQPRFNRLQSDIDKLSGEMYSDLKRNSEQFDRGFYRSVVPSFVAVSVGLLLVLLLLFFILTYYVTPICKMQESLDNYRSFNKKYNYEFDGDDQLADLNAGITEITSENQQMRKRLTALRASLNQSR